MKFSVFVAGGTDRWDPRDDRPSAKCHAMMMIAMMMMRRRRRLMMMIGMMKGMASRCK